MAGKLKLKLTGETRVDWGCVFGKYETHTETQTPGQLYVTLPNYLMFFKVYVEDYVIIVLSFAFNCMLMTMLKTMLLF
jgi:hypothetical protein